MVNSDVCIVLGSSVIISIVVEGSVALGTVDPGKSVVISVMNCSFVDSLVEKATVLLISSVLGSPVLVGVSVKNSVVPSVVSS